MSVSAANDTVRLVFFGAAGVGKSALIQRFLNDRFEERYRRTVEEMHCLNPEPGELQLRIQILDTSGSYSFPAMRKLSIQHGDAFALVFSLAEPDSFQEVERLRSEIIQVKGDAQVPIVVVANQMDLFPGVEVGHTLDLRAAATAELEWDCGYVETSAKSDYRVWDVFQELIRRVNSPAWLSPALERRRASAQPESNRNQQRRKPHGCALS